jgi:hypothetical protein
MRRGVSQATTPEPFAKVSPGEFLLRAASDRSKLLRNVKKSARIQV